MQHNQRYRLFYSMHSSPLSKPGIYCTLPTMQPDYWQFIHRFIVKEWDTEVLNKPRFSLLQSFNLNRFIFVRWLYWKDWKKIFVCVYVCVQTSLQRSTKLFIMGRLWSDTKMTPHIDSLSHTHTRTHTHTQLCESYTVCCSWYQCTLTAPEKKWPFKGVNLHECTNSTTDIHSKDAY